MNWIEFVAALMTGGLVLYLVVALLMPEKFS